MKSKQPFVSLAVKYFEEDPEAATQALESMEEVDTAEILRQMSPTVAANTVARFSDSYAAQVFKNLPDEYMKTVLGRISPEKLASIFLQLDDGLKKATLNLLDEKKKVDVQELLAYPEGSAGRMMSTNIVSFSSDLKVKVAIQKIRRLAAKGFPSSYIYVVDREQRLVGVMNMRDMLLAPDDGILERYMRTQVFTVDCFMDRADVADELTSRKYFAAPVVDGEKRLLGVVTTEQLIGNVQEAVSEDILKMFGASGHEKAFSPLSFSLKTRLPWLHVNLLTAFMAASVVALFEDIIAKITALAVFLPVVAGQGGNAGAQSLAVVMRGLVMREIPPAKVKKLVIKETVIGLVNGAVIGVVTGITTWLWQGNAVLGLVIALGMVVNLLAAGFSGAVIPLAMKAARLDPAQSSSIILTTVTDIIGFFAFLGFAVLFQSYLI